MITSRKLRGFALRDLLAVFGVAVAFIAFGVPTLAHRPHLNQREVCALNLKRIGTSCKIYANENQEFWPTPAFRRQAIDNEGIDYLAGDHVNDPAFEPGEVGYQREIESTSETPQNLDGGSTEVSVTRGFWLLVRLGYYINEEDFICPSSGDSVREVDLLFPEDLYYDFVGYHNIS